MPTIAAQQATAVVQVKRNCQLDVEPRVDEQELLDMMADYQMADIWAENTPYVIGQVVTPTARNGHKYLCVVAGTSATNPANEPSWPTGRETTILDGDSSPTLLWQEAGDDFGDQVFDIRGLSYDVWDLKAARASQLYDTSQSQSGFKESQIYDHCIKQRDKFAPLLVA